MSQWSLFVVAHRSPGKLHFSNDTSSETMINGSSGVLTGAVETVTSSSPSRSRRPDLRAGLQTTKLARVYPVVLRQQGPRTATGGQAQRPDISVKIFFQPLLRGPSGAARHSDRSHSRGSLSVSRRRNTILHENSIVHGQQHTHIHWTKSGTGLEKV